MKYFENKANEIIRQYASANLQKTIGVIAGSCRYNFRCQMNAVHDAEVSGHDKLGMFLCDDGEYVYIHFVNYDGEKFTDNTLGVWSSGIDYYFIKFIDKSEFRSINKIFTNYREFIQTIIPWWVRLFEKYDA